MEKLKLHELGRLSVEEFQAEEKFPIVLVLDNLRSGLNVGSIFRTADAFRLKKLVLCGITAQPPHREILKTALGSTGSVAWDYAADTAAAVAALKADGYRVWAVEQTDERLFLQNFQVEPRSQHAFVLGNEVNGVSEDALVLCDGVVEIPQYGTKHSLNVAVAAGIVVWEVVRQLKPGDATP